MPPHSKTKACNAAILPRGCRADRAGLCLSVLFVMALLSGLIMPAVAHADMNSVLNFDADDPEMNAAIVKARTALPEFIVRAGKADLSTGDYLVKVAVPLADGGREHIWVTLARLHGNDMLGFYANAPVLFQAAIGDPVNFGPDQISDWSYWGEDGKLYGSWTTRVMLTRMSEAESAGLRAVLAPLPDGSQ